MSADDDRPAGVEPERDYRSLPPGVRSDRTIESVDAKPVPEAGRNIDQHRALRDD
jgi:hypothetical protein